MSDQNTVDQKKEAELKQVFERALIAESVKIAQSEGFTDELAVLERANVLMADAKLEVPTTEVGQKIRAIAETAESDVRNGIPSPYTPKIQYDYNKFRDETATVAVEAILKTVLSKYDYLVAHMQDPEERRVLIDKDYEAATLDIFKIFNDNKVGISAYKYVFEMLKSVMGTLEDTIQQQVNGHRTEIMSRLLESKNPGTGKFDSSYATYEELISLLTRTREATGGKMQDYFEME